MKRPPAASLSFVQKFFIFFFSATLIVPPGSLLASLPSGAEVAHGSLDLSALPNGLNIHQLTPQAIANWHSFSIGEGQFVNIAQPDAQSILLNRVTGADPSQLMGQLTANGRVFLINPNGVVVGPNGSINTAEFLASALDVSDQDFLRGGDLVFAGDSTQSVVNLGSITATNGDVIMIAYKVTNAGSIDAEAGVAALGAGREVLLSPEGDQRLFVKTGLSGDFADGVGVENSGVIAAAQAELKAAGGNLYELAINQTGHVRATGVERKDGRVLLTAENGFVAHTGVISAQDRDGSGGEVLLGGDFRGENPEVANAARTFVGTGALIDVSATAVGADAGRAIVWADDATFFGGVIDGRASEEGGDGAFAEVSGKNYLDFQGRADLRAPQGAAGQLLLDPASLTIQAAGTESNLVTSGTDPFTFEQDLGNTPSVLLVETLENQLALSSVVLDTSWVSSEDADGSIVVNDPVSWDSGHGLTFHSGNNIEVNASLTAPGAEIVFGLGFVLAGDIFSPSPLELTANLTVDAAAHVSAETVTITRNPNATVSGSNTNFGNFGVVSFDGVLSTETLVIGYESGFGGFATLFEDDGDFDGGFDPGPRTEFAITIANPANTIGTLRGNPISTRFGGDGVLSGDLFVFDSAGGLTVEGDFISSHDIQIATVGDLTLSAGTLLQTDDGDLFLAAQGGAFINQAGPGAVDPRETGRFLIYSANPTETVKDGLVGAPVYNKTFAGNAPGTITQTGDRFLYELAPTLTFTAQNASREYGDANPIFGYTVSGLVSGDAASAVFTGVPVLDSTADATTNAGLQAGAITVAQGDLLLSDYDYQFDGVAGDLTITPAALLVTPAPATRLYGDSDPAFSGAITGFKNEETAAVLSALPTYTSDALATSGVGTYDLTASGGEATNYTFTYEAGVDLFSITPAPLTITAEDATRLYGAANPSFSAVFAGLKLDDSAANFPNLAFVTPDSDVNSNVGSDYLIRPAGATNPNYTYTYRDGALSITPAPLTITAGDASVVYFDSIPASSAFSATFSGLVADDTAADYEGQLSFSTVAVRGDSVGEYDVDATGFADSNYAVTYAPGTLTITPRALTVTAENASRSYGDNDPAFTANSEGWVNGEDESLFLTPLTFTTNAVVDSPTGSYLITPRGATAQNYSLSFVDGTLTIDPARLTVQGTNASRLYGAANPAFSATISGFKFDETAADVSGLTFSTNATTQSGVTGSYYIRPANGSLANYVFDYIDGALTITPAALTVSANNASVVFGEPIPDPSTYSATFSGLVAGDRASDYAGQLTFTNEATAGDPVGQYDIIVFGLVDPNYTIQFQPGVLTISNQILTVRANDFARLYGQANPDFTASITGFVDQDDVSILTAPVTFTTNAVLGSNVGTYTITPGGATAPNYDVSFVNGTLTINPALLTIRALDATRLYGAANPSFTADFDGFVAGDTASDVTGLSFQTNAVVTSPVGNGYTTTPENASIANYDITYETGALAITPAPLTITANDQSRVYGASDPAFDARFDARFDGLVAGDTASAIDGLVLGTDATASSGVGSDYVIAPSGATNANYTITFADGQLTITPATLTVTAQNAERLYGAANPDFAANIEGFVGDDSAADFVDPVTFETLAGVNSGVGDYAIVPGGASAANYLFHYVEGTLTVNPALLTIRAENATRVYGAADPTFAASFLGLVADDRADVISGLTFSTDAVVTSGVNGTYTITPANATSPNYTISYENGALSITPAALTITANDKSRRYGAENPTFDATVAGLVAGDTEAALGTIGFETDAELTSGVGADYVITPVGGTNENYVITIKAGRLAITPAPLQIGAENANRVYGDENPAFVPTFDGLVAGDDASVIENLSLTTDAVPASPVNTYAITPAGGANANYTITYAPGLLTVDPRPLTITAEAMSKIFGEVLDGPELDFDGLASFDDTSVIANLAINFPNARLLPVGAYPIQLSGGINPNYAITLVNGEVTVTPRAATITPTNKTRVYGEETTGFTAGVLGTVTGAPISLAGIVFETAPTEADVGTYAITASGVTDPNYTISFAEGVLTVTAAPVTFRANNASRVYGDENPELRFTTPSLKLDDTINDVLANLSLSTPATQGSSVGSYAITLAGEVINPNYDVTFAPGTFTITRAPLFVAPALSSRLYGDPDPTFTLSANGLRNGDTVSVLTGVFILNNNPAFVGVGSYPIQLLNAQANNYNVTLGNGTMNVLPRPLTIRANDVTREYGETNPTFTAQFDGLASFDQASVIPGLSFSTPATASANVLESGYGITVTSGNNANYTIRYEQGRLYVTQAPLFVGIEDASRFYGDPNPDFSTSIISGLKGADTVAQLLLRLSTDAVVTSDAGGYLIEAEITNPNYLLNTNLGTLLVNPAPLTVAVADFVRTYGDANPAGEIAFNMGGVKFAKPFGEIVAIVNPTNEVTAAGRHLFEATVLDSNYVLDSITGEVLIAPRPLNLELGSITRLYGDENPDFMTFLDLNGVFAPGDTPESVFRFITDAAVQSDVGDYEIRIGIIDTNYMPGSTGPGQLTITPRPLFVAFDALERFYGNPNPVNFDSFRVMGLGNDILPFDSLRTVLEITAPDLRADVGTYELNAELISPNYDLLSFEGTMTVMPRQITVEVPSSVARVYGGADPEIGPFRVLTPAGLANSGLASFDSVDDVLVWDLPGERTPVGTYLLSGLADTSENYRVDIVGDSVLTIEKRKLWVAVSNQTRNYGDPVGQVQLGRMFTGTNDGPASFDTMEGIVRANLPPIDAEVGRYNITLSLLDPNYELSGTFSANANQTDAPWSQINQRFLTINLPGIERLYKEENARVGVTILSGSLPSFAEMSDLFAVTMPAFDALPGAYTVARILDTKNYGITVNSGSETMMILSRVLTLNFDSFSRLYGEANPPIGDIVNQVMESGVPMSRQTLAPGDTLAAVFNYTPPAPNAAPGTYLLGAATGIPGYDVRLFSDGVGRDTFTARVSVNPRRLTVRAVNAFGIYGEANFAVELVLGGDGLASFDALGDVVQVPVPSELSRDARSGYYLIDDVTGDEVNYVIDFTPGVFTLLPRPVTLNVPNVVRTFDSIEDLAAYLGNEDLVLNASVSGLRSGDTIDTAFPIIRYQLVGNNGTPPLPVVPTADTVEVPSVAQLLENPARLGSGVALRASAGTPSGSGVTRLSVARLNDETSLEGFATVFDGFDTERDYVLSGVNNGTASLRIRGAPPTVSTDVSSGTITIPPLDLSAFQEKLEQQQEEARRLAESQNTTITVSSGTRPPLPKLDSLFRGGDFSLGIDMINGLVESLMGDGGNYTFPPGSLLYEITRSESGSIGDVTEFRIRRFFERNANNPDLLALLAEPLAHYSTEILKRDSSTYTDQEKGFVRLLEDHLSRSRSDVAVRMAEKRDAWVAQEEAKGQNLVSLFGRDVPWDNFMSEAAGEYVADNLEGKIAGTALAAGASATAAGVGIATLTSFIMPFAFGKSAAVGLSTSIAAGTATTAAGGAAAVVAIPVAIVAGAVVGSVARGIQVFETADQKAAFDAIQADRGRRIDAGNFSLTNSDGADHTLNQTILAGALAGMLFGQ